MGEAARAAKAKVPPPDEFTQEAYDKAQAAVDARENELEKQGINPMRLFSTDEPGNKILQGVEDWKPMPPDLEALYHARDQIGAGMLKGSISEISRRMVKAGVKSGDIKDILEYYAMDPEKTDAFGQYMASEHSQGMVNEVPLKRQFEELYIKLAAKRGIDISTNDLENGVYRDLQTVADVKAAMKAIHGYFKGTADVETLALPEPSEQPNAKEQQNGPQTIDQLYSRRDEVWARIRHP